MSLNSTLRGIPLFRLLLDEYPVKVSFPDGRSRVVPRRLGRMIYLWQAIAECRDESASVLRAYSGGDVIDVGAFHGWYSVLLAHKMNPGDRAVSIEPDSRAQGDLLRNLAALGQFYPSISFVVLPIAAGDGEVTHVTYPHGGASHPSFTRLTERSMERKMQSTTVDAVVEGLKLEPALIKIDVEGAESLVIAGMRKTLAKHRPKLMLEFHPLWQPPGYSRSDLTHALEAFGYSSVVLSRSTLAVRELWESG